MGFTLTMQKLFSGIVRHRGLRSGAVLTYGVQKMPGKMKAPTCENYMRHCGFDPIHSIDVYDREGPTYVENMDHPVHLPRKYDLIFDGGTIEHCFSTASVLSNTVGFLDTGGMVLHFTPMNNWAGHGFYQFSPGLFYDFYYDNGFTDLNCWLIVYHEQKIIPVVMNKKHRKFNGLQGEVMVVFAACKGKDQPIVYPIQEKYREPHRNYQRKDIDNWSREVMNGLE